MKKVKGKEMIADRYSEISPKVLLCLLIRFQCIESMEFHQIIPELGELERTS